MERYRGIVRGALIALLVVVAAACQTEAEAGADRDRMVILVTGSTDGLGRELAMRLASEGAHLIIHGRDVERGHEVVAAIETEGVGSASFHPADFASFDEIRGLAETIRREHDRLDVLVNNAGVGPGAPGHERVLTPEGQELRFQVNYLAGYLLTRELLPLLRDSAPARIVNVTSRNQQPLDFDDLTIEEGYSGGLAYGRSKLAQILFTIDLAEELEGTGVTAYAVHPAPAMETDLVRETGSRPQSPVSQGVEAVWRVIMQDGFPNGQYFHELEPAQPHDQALDPEARRRLRQISDDLTRAPSGG